MNYNFTRVSTFFYGLLTQHLCAPPRYFLRCSCCKWWQRETGIRPGTQIRGSRRWWSASRPTSDTETKCNNWRLKPRGWTRLSRRLWRRNVNVHGVAKSGILGSILNGTISFKIYSTRQQSRVCHLYNLMQCGFYYSLLCMLWVPRWITHCVHLYHANHNTVCILGIV